MSIIIISCLTHKHTAWTALHYATRYGHHQCIEALVPVTPPTPLHLETFTPVHLASYWGQVAVLEQLVDAGWALTNRNRGGETPLHYAARGGHVTAVQWLVQRGGDPCMKTKGGHTPLDVAVFYGCHEVETWLLKNGGGALRSENRFVDEVVRLYSCVLFWMNECPAVGGKDGKRRMGWVGDRRAKEVGLERRDEERNPIT